jgi:hypothetical protein
LKSAFIFIGLVFLNMPLYRFLYKLHFKSLRVNHKSPVDDEHKPLGFSRENARSFDTEFRSAMFLMVSGIITVLEYWLIRLFLW